MSWKKSESRENRAIYLLLSYDRKCFYINHGLQSTLINTYRKIVRGERESSRAFIESLSPERPCFFLLNNLNDSTEHEAYMHMIVWLKVLLEKGYTSYNSDEIIRFTNPLWDECSPLYECKKQVDLDFLTSCDNCLLPKYKGRLCPKYPFSECDKLPEPPPKRDRIIHLRMTDDEYETIKAKAKEAHMHVTPYLRRVAINPSITVFDYSIIERNPREIASVRATLNRYVFTIELTNNYLPKEAESMVHLMERIFEVQNTLLEKLRNQRITIRDCEEDGLTYEPKGLI